MKNPRPGLPHRRCATALAAFFGAAISRNLPEYRVRGAPASSKDELCHRENHGKNPAIFRVQPHLSRLALASTQASFPPAPHLRCSSEFGFVSPLYYTSPKGAIHAVLECFSKTVGVVVRARVGLGQA